MQTSVNTTVAVLYGTKTKCKAISIDINVIVHLKSSRIIALKFTETIDIRVTQSSVGNPYIMNDRKFHNLI